MNNLKYKQGSTPHKLDNIYIKIDCPKIGNQEVANSVT